MAVVDASVYVALAHPDDPHHDRARAWIEGALEAAEPLRAPLILAAEVAAALRRGVGDLPLARRVVDQLLEGGLVDLHPVDRALGEQAAIVALAAELRGCDAIYVALAAITGEPLVTLDRQQLERGARVAVTVFPETDLP